MKKITVKIKNSRFEDGKFITAQLYNFESTCTSAYEFNRVLHALSLTSTTLEKENNGFTYIFPFILK